MENLHQLVSFQNLPNVRIYLVTLLTLQKLCITMLWSFRMVVLGLQNAGAVIGKGGSNIKRLRQDVSHRFYCSTLPYMLH